MAQVKIEKPFNEEEDDFLDDEFDDEDDSLNESAGIHEQVTLELTDQQYVAKSFLFLEGHLSFHEYELVLEEEEQKQAAVQQKAAKCETERRVRRFLPPALAGLMGQANLCYAKGDHDSALNMCLEVVRQMPTAPEPFQTLSELYEEKGMKDKSLEFAMIAAYLDPSHSEQWINLGERSVQIGNIGAAISCYTKALKFDPGNVGVHVTRAGLLLEKGERKASIKAYHRLVEVVMPCPEVLKYAKLAAHMYHEDNDVPKAKEVMEMAFNKVPDLVLSEDVNLYVELLLLLKEYFKALEVMSKYCDVKIEAEEDIVANSETHKLTCSSFRVLTCDIPPDIPVQIRVKLTVTLIHLKSCNLLNMLLTPFLEDENVEQIGDLLVDVAEALMSEGMYVEALKLLKLLVDSKNFSQAAVWLNYADCLRSLGRCEEAISAYLMVMQQAPKHVEARLMVSELLNDLGRSDEAISVLTQDPAAGSLDAALLYERCMLLKGNKDRTDEFLAVGRLLLSRHCVRIKSRDDLQPLSKLKGYAKKQEALRRANEGASEEPSLVEGKKLPVADEEWALFEALCQTAFETQEHVLLQRIVFGALGSSILNNTEKREATVFLLAILACFFNQDAFHGYNMARDMILSEHDNPAAWNLFNAILCNSEDTRHYKFIMRQLSKKKTHSALTMLHANNCFITGSYKFALSEYMSAFKQQPSELLVFMIAVCLLQMSCQKFTDLKNSLVTQAVAFLLKYKEMRGEKNIQEVHYNMGRFYHQLGVLSSAIYHYKQGLLAPTPLAHGLEHMFDLKKEITFNLVSIYQAAGATDLARHYTEKYFVV